MVLELENKVTGAGRVLVFFGMIATGKSYLAAAWAKRHGCSYYNSDRVRKELAGLVPESRQGVAVDQGIYSRDFSRKTYDRLLLLAEKDLEEIPGPVWFLMAPIRFVTNGSGCGRG